MTASTIYLVSSTPCMEVVKDASAWNKTQATTLDGAKRIAMKRAEGVTYSARVGRQGPGGEVETLATLHNTTAITRRRAVWVNSPGAVGL